ncbi:hypothetical protein HPB47_009163 [Ixodes persulcatus]|uniref:Uncharacterized protein n=1 Tax=Ixodes persulcatus TaxID=34615 RepID=A0AC60P2W1_IXOPE|nr:hypothetical protein HPB47_009163 [Ixodes persulcatus]
MKLQEIVRLLLAGTIVGICSSQNDSEQDETPAQVLHYRKLFKLRRQERLEAVKSILKLDNMEKQAKLVNIVLGKIAEVLTASKVKLENSDYIPGGNFPHDDETRDGKQQGSDPPVAVKSLRTQAFFGEIVLRLPDISHAVLGENKASALMVHWAVGFANATGFYDDTTTELVGLVAQELGLVDKDPSYHNPYAAKHAKEDGKEGLPSLWDPGSCNWKQPFSP